jgi:hypothetical protein
MRSPACSAVKSSPAAQVNRRGVGGSAIVLTVLVVARAQAQDFVVQPPVSTGLSSSVCCLISRQSRGCRYSSSMAAVCARFYGHEFHASVKHVARIVSPSANQIFT